RSIVRLLFGSDTCACDDVKTNIKEILALQSAFCLHYKLGRSSARGHRRRLRADLVQRLMALGSGCFSRGEDANAAKLLIQTIPLASAERMKRLLPASLKLLTKRRAKVLGNGIDFAK